MRISSENFIKEMKNNNLSALNFFVENYSNLIYKVIVSVLGSNKKEDCMECLNDVIFKVWRNIPYYDEKKSKFPSWIIAVSKYNAIDYKRKNTGIKETEDIENVTLVDNKKVEDEVVANENKEELIKLINEMAEPDKEIFIRRYFLDESITEICESLMLTRTAVDNRLFRGRKVLRDKLTCNREEVI